MAVIGRRSGMSMVVVAMGGGRSGMAVIVMAVIGRRSGMSMVVVAMSGGRCGMAVVVMPMISRGRMGIVPVSAIRSVTGTMTVISAVIVVRLVLVAHSDSIPHAAVRGLCGEIGIT